MDKDLTVILDRIGNTIGGVSGEIKNQCDLLCARLNLIVEKLGYINGAIESSCIENHLPGIEHALERIAYALERKNEWESIKRPSLAKSND